MKKVSLYLLLIQFILNISLQHAFSASADLPLLKPKLIHDTLKFESPVFLTHTSHFPNSVFVVEQSGRIKSVNLLKPDTSHLMLDLGKKVRRVHSEEGLLGMAFHPSFADNGVIIIHYSASLPRRNVISRFTYDFKNNTLVPGSEDILLTVNQPYGNHNGGMIAFGKDGYLYISLGDGGHAGDPHDHGQNLNSLLGKILRIDVGNDKGYLIPSDNPFLTLPEVRKEIFAYGLRNVWRFSFDRLTGELWGGDVGQDLFEEINMIQKGGNYGWAYFEGFSPFKPSTVSKNLFQKPLAVHPRHDAKSITGGYVYRGPNPDWQGVYIYGDFVTGNIWGMTVSSKPKLIGSLPFISSFGEDHAGNIYALSYFEGTIYTLI